MAVVGFVSALVATVAASMGFVVEYAIGGAAGASLGTVTGYMLLTHTLIGIGEGVITAVTVTAVARSRPDLIYLLRDRERSAAPRLSLNTFLLAFAAVAAVVAGLLSYVASSQPDGLDATTLRGCVVVGEQLQGDCIAQYAGEHHLAGSPFAEYTIGGNGALTGVAGILGVAATFAVLFALVRIIRARPRVPQRR